MDPSALFYIAFFLLLYLLPSLIAIARRNRLVAVIVLNLLIGWTVIGWFVAFALAFVGPAGRVAAAPHRGKPSPARAAAREATRSGDGFHCARCLAGARRRGRRIRSAASPGRLVAVARPADHRPVRHQVGLRRPWPRLSWGAADVHGHARFCPFRLQHRQQPVAPRPRPAGGSTGPGHHVLVALPARICPGIGQPG